MLNVHCVFYSLSCKVKVFQLLTKYVEVISHSCIFPDDISAISWIPHNYFSTRTSPRLLKRINLSVIDRQVFLMIL